MPGARGAQCPQEGLHIGGQCGVTATGLRVEEPAVEAVRRRDLHQLRGEREVPGRVLLHQVAGPAQLSAVGDRRQEDRAQHRDAVTVCGIDDRCVRRQDQALAGRAAPEDQLVEVGPVGRRVVVSGRRALRRVARGAVEGRERADPGLAGAGRGVRRNRGEALGRRHGRGVERQIPVLPGSPGLEAAPGDAVPGRARRERVGEPVRGIRFRESAAPARGRPAAAAVPPPGDGPSRAAAQPAPASSTRRRDTGEGCRFMRCSSGRGRMTTAGAATGRPRRVCRPR